MKITKVNEKLDNVTITDNTVVIPQPTGAAVEESENLWKRFEEATKEPEDAPLFGAKEQPVPEEPVEAKMTLDEGLFNNVKDYLNESWTGAYSQFTDIVDKYFPDEEQIEAAVESLYDSHKGEPDWDEAWHRWNENDGLDESLDDDTDWEAFTKNRPGRNKIFDRKTFGKYFDKNGHLIPELKSEYFQKAGEYIASELFDESLKEDWDDGWDADKVSGVKEVCDEVYNLSYELENARRGVYTRATTYEELGDYVSDLGNRLSLAGEELMELDDGEEDDMDESVLPVNDLGTLSPQEIAKVENRRDELWDKEGKGTITPEEKIELGKLQDKINRHYAVKKQKMGE